MRSYKFRSDVCVTYMSDGSGLALYSKYSGNTAFLHSASFPSQKIPKNCFDDSFNDAHLVKMLGLTHEKALHSLKWLYVNNYTTEIG